MNEISEFCDILQSHRGEAPGSGYGKHPRAGHYLRAPRLRSQVSTVLTSGTFDLSCGLLNGLQAHPSPHQTWGQAMPKFTAVAIRTSWACRQKVSLASLGQQDRWPLASA